MKTQEDIEKIRQLLNFFFQEEASLRFHFNHMSSVLGEDTLSSYEKLKVVEKGVKEIIKFIEMHHENFEILWMKIYPELDLGELFREFALEGFITNDGIDPEEYNVAFPPNYEPLHEFFPSGAMTPLDRFEMVFMNGPKRICVMLN